MASLRLAPFGVLFGVTACAADGGTAARAAGAGSGNGGGGGLIIGGGGTTGEEGYLPIGDGSGSSPVGADSGCPEIVQETQPARGGKADIIWVLDNSSSMIEEALGVQDNMNAFSAFITQTGIDVHVVAISGPQSPIWPGICVAPPLGSGRACPDDSNPPLYTRITPMGLLATVDSHNALENLTTTYPQWQSYIRPDSTKTFVVVTDDEANPSPSVAEFTTFWNEAWKGSTWRFSGIFCKGLSENCSGIGVTYDQLVTQTGGTWVDMGNPNPDWTAVFRQLGDAIVADAKPVDCAWKIPPIPGDLTFDPDFVNVKFTPTAGATETLIGVDGPQFCTDAPGGWYVDGEQMTVIACPTTCARMQADAKAKVAVAFGCKRRTEIE